MFRFGESINIVFFLPAIVLTRPQSPWSHKLLRTSYNQLFSHLARIL